MAKSTIDSACSGLKKYDSFAYFFRNNQYIKYDWSKDGIVSGSVTPLSSWGFPGKCANGIDAAFTGSGNSAGKTYFFKDDEYVRYDWDSEKVDDGYPMALSTWNLPGDFANGIDAAVEGYGDNKGKVYFFKGSQYLRFDMDKNAVDENYPKPLSEWKFPGDLANGIDAALNGKASYDGKVYFFKGNQYIRYDWKNDSPDDTDPKDISTWGIQFDGQPAPANNDAGSGSTDVVISILKPDPANLSVMKNVDLANDSIWFGMFNAGFNRDSSGQPQLRPDFIDGDERRFQIAIKDQSVTGDTLEASLYTTWPDGTSKIETSIDMTIVLTRDTSGSYPAGTFISKPFMLVHEEVDMPATVDGVAKGAKGYRLRLGGMFSFLGIDYGGKSVMKEIIIKNDRKNIPANFFILRDSSKTAIMPGLNAINQITEIQKVYDNFGIFLNGLEYLNKSVLNFSEEQVKNQAGISYYVNTIDLPSNVPNVNNVTMNDMVEIAKVVTQNPHPIRIFFVNGFDAPTVGAGTMAIAFNKSYVTSANLDVNVMFCIFVRKDAFIYDVAHEMGHLLMDKLLALGSSAPSGDYTHHFQTPDDAKYPQELDLMHPFNSSTTESILSRKRLWDIDDKDGFNQYKSLVSNSQGLLQ